MCEKNILLYYCNLGSEYFGVGIIKSNLAVVPSTPGYTFPPFIQLVPMSVLNFPTWQHYQIPGQITSFWHHGAHPSSTTFQNHSYPPLPQSQFFNIFLQLFSKFLMVILIFKIHCLIVITI